MKTVRLTNFLEPKCGSIFFKFFFRPTVWIFTDFLTELIEIIPYFLYPSRKIHRPTLSSTKFMNRTCFTLMYPTNTRIGWLESRGMERQKRQPLQDQVKSRSNFWLRTLKPRWCGRMVILLDWYFFSVLCFPVSFAVIILLKGSNFSLVLFL